MRPWVLALLLCFFSAVTVAHAYEFHLLNGMVIKGALTAYKDGKFYAATDFGAVVVDADKLDYIIVNEGDGRTSAQVPGPGLSPDVSVVEPAPGQTTQAVPSLPEPVHVQAKGPQPPPPLQSRSVPPLPLRSWSLGNAMGGDFYPGLFTGSKKKAPAK